MAVTNPQTIATLRELGCLKVDDRLDTSAIARLLAERLTASHIATSIGHVPAVEVTVGQLATALIGEEDAEFVEALKPLLSASAAGPVQQALDNGYVLCGGRARIDITIEGQVTHTSIATRFLSADHDVVERYVLEPRIRRAESFANSSVALRDLVADRQPDMAPQLGTFIEKLNITWQRALGTGDAA
jgi:hypothetical protein